MAMPHRYLIAGLPVASDFELPHAKPAEGTAPSHDGDAVIIRRVAALPRPEGTLGASERFAADPQDFWFAVDDGLAMRVRRGARIDVFCPDLSRVRDVVLFLMGSAWGVLCHQRGWLPLHCSAAARGDRAVAICGASGEGKSTMAAAMASRGYAHVCDDVALIAQDGEEAARHVRFTPVDKGLKLKRDAAARLGAETTGAVAGACGMDKVYARPPLKGDLTNYRLAAIVELRSVDRADVALRRLTGAEAFSVVDDNVYRREWIPVLREPREVFGQIAACLSGAPVYALERPRDLARLEDGAASLAQALLAPAGDD